MSVPRLILYGLSLGLALVLSCGEADVDQTENSIVMEECHPDCGGSVFVFNDTVALFPLGFRVPGHRVSPSGDAR